MEDFSTKQFKKNTKHNMCQSKTFESPLAIEIRTFYDAVLYFMKGSTHSRIPLAFGDLLVIERKMLFFLNQAYKNLKGNYDHL